MLDDEGERDRDHREIGTAHAQRWQRQHGAHRSGKSPRDRQRNPKAQAFERENGGGVGADRIKADVTERDLTGKAEQHVEAHAHDDGERDQRQNEMRVSFGLERKDAANCHQGKNRERH